MRRVMEVVENKFKETEIGLIPEDWEVVRLGEVAEKMKAGGTPKRSEKRFWDGSIPFILIEDLTKNNLYIKDAREYITEEGLENSNAWIVPENSLLLSMYATIGETAVNLIPVATNQAILGIIPKRDRLNVEFGAYLLKFHSKRLLSQNIQTTQRNVNKGIVENFLIPLPPLEEQKAIADILSTVQNAIEKTEKVINATKQLKKSMMKHLFTYGAVAVDEIDKVKLKESEIGLIPEHWEVVRLGEVFKITQKPKNLKLENYNLIPFIPMENIGFGTFNPKYVMKNPKDISSGTYFEKGDLLLAKITPSFENGKQSIVDDIPTEFGIATTEVIPIKQTEKSLISYLFHYLLKPEFRKYLASKMEGSTGRKRLPKEVLFNTLIPLPPLDEQQKIANILTTIDQKIQAEEKKKEALQNLFKTLLQQLMTGKIRVKKAKT
jgi:type I restriction enzyme S subunit